MTLDGYTSLTEATTVAAGPGPIAWAVLAVLAVVSAVVGSTGASALLRSWREADYADQHWLDSAVAAWGEPDLTPPSQTSEAQAEVADLEALWRR